MNTVTLHEEFQKQHGQQLRKLLEHDFSNPFYHPLFICHGHIWQFSKSISILSLWPYSKRISLVASKQFVHIKLNDSLNWSFDSNEELHGLASAIFFILLSPLLYFWKTSNADLIFLFSHFRLTLVPLLLGHVSNMPAGFFATIQSSLAMVAFTVFPTVLNMFLWQKHLQ